MKNLEVITLAIPAVKILRFARFLDNRGYFSETFRHSDLAAKPELKFFTSLHFLQANESHSQANVIRGMHFQWNPYMGKLVRAVFGRLVDIVLDIRKGSPYYGKVIMANLPADHSGEYGEWIWVPPGFAHGTFLPEESIIEYFCTGEYSAGNEACVSPLAGDLDWSLCDVGLLEEFTAKKSKLIISEKDANGLTLQQWSGDPRSENFLFSKLP